MDFMRVVRIHEFGGPDVLQLEDVPLPVPQEDEILVRIAAASVNPVDYKTRQGKFPPAGKVDLPITPGRDLAGIVERCGAAVQNIRTGDAVFALLGQPRGTYAQFAVVRQNEFAPQPKNLSAVQAAAVPLAALTAWQGLFVEGGLQAGQRVLIHGGAGGVGHLAIQLAKAEGAFVVTTASQGDLEFVRQMGADQVIDYKNQAFEDEAKDIDLVYDLIGGDTQTRSFAVLKKDGALVSTVKEPDKDKAKEKNIRAAHYMAVPSAAQLAQIGGLIVSGKVKPTIQATFALQDAAKAQSLLEDSHVRGKIVLTLA